MRKNVVPKIKINVEEYSQLMRKIALGIMQKLPHEIGLTDKFFFFEDLISAGYLGLLDATRKFKENKKNSFSTYAYYRIKGAMWDEMKKLNFLKRLSREKLKKVNQAIDTLKNELLREPTREEVAEKTKIKLEEIDLLILLAKKGHFEPLKKEHISDYSLNLYSEKDEIIEKIFYFEAWVLIEKALNVLSPREIMIIYLFIYEKISMKEIGDIWNISESRISQIYHQQIIEKIRKEIDKIK